MTTYDKRLHRFFNVDSARDAFVSAGYLGKTEFDQVIKDTVKVRRLYLEGLDWLLMDQLMAQYRQVPFLTHCEALSCGLGRPFEGVQDLYETLANLELIPAAALNQTVVNRAPRQELLFGELAAEAGVVSNMDLQRALGVQRILWTQTGSPVAIGQVFRALGCLSVVDFFQILALQSGIPFTSLDESAPRIWDAAAKRPHHS